MCRSLFLFFYTSNLGQSRGHAVWAGGSSVGTVHCKATFLFSTLGAHQHLHLCLVFVQYPTVWTISYYIKPQALAKAYNCYRFGSLVVAGFFFFLHH